MEAVREYRPSEQRPRLTVVRDGAATYSALPHAVLFSDLPDGAVRLYAVLQSHWWQSGECFASNATLAGEMRCSDSQLRRYFVELLKAGHITSRRAGRGQAKAYAPTKSTVNGDGQPFISERFNRSSVSGLEPNRSPAAPQPFTGDDPNRSPVTVPYKKTPEKKTPEEKENSKEEVPDTDVVVGATRATPKPTSDQAEVLRALSPGAREVLDWWRECHGKKRPPRLNPTQVRLLEEAIADLGIDRLLEAVRYMAGKGVSEIDKARTAAYTKRQKDEDDGLPVAPLAPYVNGVASKLIPATDDDLTLWSRVLTDLRSEMNTSNFEAYMAPLEVAGRGEDGGLWLIVNPLMAEHTARFKAHISRSLREAGDAHPAAVRFKARKRTQEYHDDEE